MVDFKFWIQKENGNISEKIFSFSRELEAQPYRERIVEFLDQLEQEWREGIDG